jgi:uncharacterized membrane protein YqjE
MSWIQIVVVCLSVVSLATSGWSVYQSIQSRRTQREAARMRAERFRETP